MRLSRFRFLAAAAGFILSATAALAQQPPAVPQQQSAPPPAEARGFVNGLAAIENQVAAFRAAAELMVRHQAEEADALRTQLVQQRDDAKRREGEVWDYAQRYFAAPEKPAAE